jgi:hypothetical protein
MCRISTVKKDLEKIRRSVEKLDLDLRARTSVI